MDLESMASATLTLAWYEISSLCSRLFNENATIGFLAALFTSFWFLVGGREL